jgi:ABC-type transporter Mla subunit MlaD
VLGIGVIVAAMRLLRDEFNHVTSALESKYAVSGLGPQVPVRLLGAPIGKVIHIIHIEFEP